MNYKDIAENNLILKVRVGSHLFGTNTPDSDIDYEGIFLPSIETILGLSTCKEVDLGFISKDKDNKNTKDAIDFKVREYRSFCKLALQNNPNILNILFANNENIITINDYGQALKEKAPVFVHKGCINRYKSYAKAQLKKATIKPDNYKAFLLAREFLALANPKELLINFITSYSEQDRIKLEKEIGQFPCIDLGIGKHIQIGDMFFERGINIGKTISIIDNRLDRVSSRSKMWQKYGFDLKFASNLIQLLIQGLELVKYGIIEFPLKEANLILEIKKGSFTLDQIIKGAEEIEKEIIAAEKITRLPSEPRFKEIESFIIMQLEKWLTHLWLQEKHK